MHKTKDDIYSLRYNKELPVTTIYSPAQTCDLSQPSQPAVAQNFPWLAQNYGCDNKFWVLIAVFCEFLHFASDI